MFPGQNGREQNGTDKMAPIELIKPSSFNWQHDFLH